MHFVKMHGLSNDYVFVDADREQVPDPPALSRRISLPHTGIGSDGLVLFRRGKAADFEMRMFNQDGSEGEMCGNAARCLGKYLYERGYTEKTEFTLDTLAGVRTLYVAAEHRLVRSVAVDMGEPAFTPKDIGLALPVDEEGRVHLEAAGTAWTLMPVSMGNPHVVAFVPDAQATPLAQAGPPIEHHPAFSARTNVEFVQVLSREHILVRVWERGSGETQACGTGACAAWAASAQAGKTGRKGTVSLPGGDLTLSWSENNHIYMEGTAAIVFEGEWLAE